MAYPFVAARWFSPGKLEELRAVVIHMAEGGGTVEYFRKTDRDVSSHFVIEYTGRTVQMVRDGDADHCQHVSAGTWKYGNLSPAVGRSVLGSDVMDSPDHTRVNRYVFAVEIEGYRAKGPNTAQKAALVALVHDLRSRYRSLRGVIGHGDVQDKPCPGQLIPWADLGGHGLFATVPSQPQKEEELIALTVTTSIGQLTAKRAGTAFNIVTRAGRPFAAGYVRNVVAAVQLEEGLSPALPKGEAMYLTTQGDPDDLELIRALDVEYTPKAGTDPDCTAAIAAAVDPVQRQLDTATSRIRQAVTALGGRL